MGDATQLHPLLMEAFQRKVYDGEIDDSELFHKLVKQCCQFQESQSQDPQACLQTIFPRGEQEILEHPEDGPIFLEFKAKYMQGKTSPPKQKEPRPGFEPGGNRDQHNAGSGGSGGTTQNQQPITNSMIIIIVVVWCMAAGLALLVYWIIDDRDRQLAAANDENQQLQMVNSELNKKISSFTTADNGTDEPTFESCETRLKAMHKTRQMHVAAALGMSKLWDEISRDKPEQRVKKLVDGCEKSADEITKVLDSFDSNRSPQKQTASPQKTLPISQREDGVGGAGGGGGAGSGWGGPTPRLKAMRKLGYGETPGSVPETPGPAAAASTHQNPEPSSDQQQAGFGLGPVDVQQYQHPRTHLELYNALMSGHMPHNQLMYMQHNPHAQASPYLSQAAQAVAQVSRLGLPQLVPQPGGAVQLPHAGQTYITTSHDDSGCSLKRRTVPSQPGQASARPPPPAQQPAQHSGQSSALPHCHSRNSENG